MYLRYGSFLTYLVPLLLKKGKGNKRGAALDGIRPELN